MSDPTKTPTDVAEEPLWKVIVLTGGPCGGKTTALAEVAERLRSLGLQVFVQPEVSTLLSVSGAGFPAASGAEYRHAWETERLRFQIAMEDCFKGIAVSSKRATVLLCDRGAGDAAAYCDADAWITIAGNTLPQSRNARQDMVLRYDLVLHLVSAAVGAEPHYNKAGNIARRETLQEAVECDRRVMAAWDTHPQRRIVDNSTDFEGKIRRVVTAICSYLGVLSPTAHRRRFVVRSALFAPPSGVRIEDFRVRYTFLAGSTEEENFCVRERESQGATTYFFARKIKSGEITERAISRREAKSLLVQGVAPDAASFRRNRRAFVTAEHYFELDDINDDPSEWVLQVEVPARDSPVVFPEWLAKAVVKQIPSEDEQRYSVYATACRIARAQAVQSPPKVPASSPVS